MPDTLGRLEGRIPPDAVPGLPVRRLLVHLASLDDKQNPTHVVWRWMDDMSSSAAARELLLAAVDASPAERVVAVDVVEQLGEAAARVCRELATFPTIGPHARALLTDGSEGRLPVPDTADLVWLAVEYALAELARHGSADAWYVIQRAMGDDVDDAAAAIRDSGHPGAGELVGALRRFSDAGVRIPVYQLKVSLRRTNIWRRVRVRESATLGDLHQMIRALMGWDGTRLHGFTVGERSYSDPFFQLEDCSDENFVRLNRVLPKPRAKITYVYDFRDRWRHAVMLERVLAHDEGLTHPLCVGGSGDNPAEDHNPEYPAEPVPFDQDAINKVLAGTAASIGFLSDDTDTESPDW